MNKTYEKSSLYELLRENEYPGRGIAAGMTPDGRAALAYFIMGRSENSRNRVFRAESDDVTIYPFDASKVEDPSLIIYSPVRVHDGHTVFTNGDQTDTVYDALIKGRSFETALETRCFEPDAPNFTPRISGIISREKNTFIYKLSILKSADADGSACARYTFSYPAIKGEGRFISTYEHNANPLPTFEGEPRRISMYDDIDEFADGIWESLNADNKISLYVRYIDVKTGKYESRLYNKHEGGKA